MTNGSPSRELLRICLTLSTQRRKPKAKLSPFRPNPCSTHRVNLFSQLPGGVAYQKYSSRRPAPLGCVRALSIFPTPLLIDLRTAKPSTPPPLALFQAFSRTRHPLVQHLSLRATGGSHRRPVLWTRPMVFLDEIGPAAHSLISHAAFKYGTPTLPHTGMITKTSPRCPSSELLSPSRPLTSRFAFCL